MKKKFIKRWLLPPGILDLFIRGKIAVTKGIKKSSIEKLLNSSEILENSNLGERCFIFGAGSSINRQDLRRLVGESVISVSNTFVHPDYANIKPKYHVLPPLQQGHGQMHSESNFVSWLAEMEKKVTDAAIFLHIGDYNLVHQNHLFKNHQIYWVDYCSWSGDLNFPIDLSRIPYIWSVSELAITVALYQGFSKIYLIGIDHDWFNGPLIYFFDHEKDHSLKPNQDKLVNKFGVDAEFQMRRHADIFKKYKYLYSKNKNIFNANADPDHYLDVFPKVDFASLFNDKRKDK